MIQPVITGLLWFSAIGCGLLGGLYFALSAFGMTALGRIDQAAGNAVSLPDQFVELLLVFGADPNLRNNKGQTPLDLALAEIGSIAEEYFPPMPRGSKNLEPAITLLQKK